MEKRLEEIKLCEDPEGLIGYVDFNELVAISMETDKNVSLHIAEFKGVPFAQVSKRLTHGLQRLADMLGNDPKMNNVEIVTTTSWIVNVHPKILERLGFTVDKDRTNPLGLALLKKYEDEKSLGGIDTKQIETEAGFAWMSKEDFIKRHRQIRDIEIS
jgi:hypothetical protein